jgi:hypothetical protein
LISIVFGPKIAPNGMTIASNRKDCR